MRKRAIFGGSFNPIHLGHVNFCNECQKQYNFDEIILIPSNIPPHKSADELVSGADRLKMTELAASGYAYMRVSDIELRHGGKSYTVDTIEELNRIYEKDELFLLIGSDMLLSFKTWHRYEKILELVKVVAGARQSEDKQEIINIKSDFAALSDRISIIDLEIVEISSTQVRNAVKSGIDVNKYLDNKVYDYIKEKGLYL